MLVIESLSFAYDTSGTMLIDDLSLRLPAGWTGVFGANGAGTSTLLSLVAGRLEPMAGRVRSPGAVVLCPQRTDDPPPGLDDVLASDDADGHRLRGRLGLDPAWAERWGTLSHGERKRAQIAAALHRRPDVLAVDEPTNHLDAESARLLGDALRSFRGVGLIVSHDRDLLDRLCARCVLIDPPETLLRPGGYTKAMEQVEGERAQVRREREQARSEMKRLRRESASRGREAAAADKRRSKRKLGARDHDAKSKIDAARVSGKDGQAGRVKRQMDGRLQQAADRLDAARVAKERRHDLTLPGARSHRDRLAAVPAGRIALGPTRALEHDDLVIGPDDRIAVTGPNGCGKSTLVRHLVETISLPDGRVVYLPQEIDATRARAIVAEARDMPASGLGEVLTIVACLGSHAERLLETDLPSPGELRKLLLALGAARRRCLLASHDARFLDKLTRTQWCLERDAHDDDVVRVTPS